MPRTFLSLALLACASVCFAEPAAIPAKPQAAKSPYTGGNRLAYLDQIDPYYPHRDFAKLITPQWVGEEGVEVVVILSIDDMRDPVRYEQFLRPILDRLKKVGNSDGLSRMSIFTNSVDPKHEQLQKWLKEGLSFEVHTITHPCPCLGQGAAVVGAKPGTIEAAKQTYDGCVDLLHQIPNYKGPVAYRMPCCDSMNSVSPRFFAEVMNKTTKEGHFLSIDSSVFNVFTSDDPALPRELVQEKDGSERFAKYAKFPGFVNTIENYPYPYVIGNMIWQFPCVVPSDWEAQHLHKPNNPKTVEDLKANLDCTVIKQGVFTLVFHPHGWIKAEQVVELIDHAEKKHGKKVKFLNFQDALERINKNMLKGHAIRNAKGDNDRVHVLDFDDDRFVDALVEADQEKFTQVWDRDKSSWRSILHKDAILIRDEAGPVRPTRWGTDSVYESNDHQPARTISIDGGSLHIAFHLEAKKWLAYGPGPDDLNALDLIQRAFNGGLGCDVLVEYKNGTSEVYDGHHRVRRFGHSLPPTVRLTRGHVGGDTGLRFVDLDGDRDLDIVFSNAERFDVHLFKWRNGWSEEVVSVKRGVLPPEKDLPPIVRADGTNNGFFVKGDALYWQNEDTGGKEPHHVKKITFAEVLALGTAKARELQAPVPGAQGAPAPGAHNFTTAHAAPPPPRSPEVSRDSIKVREGFRVELVAAEPLVLDPIAFDWGPDGRLWVVEMADYPLGMDGKGKPGGRVVYLEDTDGDARYDKRTVFLDELPMPTGVMVWKKGVLVAATPNLFFAEDTDGDGKADKREVLFTGFSEGNPQHRFNGMRWGLDGWIYLANGDSGGQVKNLTQPDSKPVNISGRDIRIRPVTLATRTTADDASDDGAGFNRRSVKLGLNPKLTAGEWEIEPQSGQSQFGRERDDFGNWFANNNPNPGWHYVLEDHYLRRNPHVAAPSPRVDLTGDRTIYPISVVFSPSIENHRISPGQPAQHSSANSITIYRDELFGEHFYGNAFISEPVHNLVRRLVLKPSGVTFRGERAPGEERSEFLASSDPWFRPTTLRTGPDGCLWIADMYRQTIEHPEWIPPQWQKAVNLREGDDKGRIYRVVPVHAKPRAMVRLDKLDAKGLVAAMDSPNGWQRDMVQMMLMWRASTAINTEERKQHLNRLYEEYFEGRSDANTAKMKRAEIELHTRTVGVQDELERMAREATHASVRAQALWLLLQRGLSDGAIFREAVRDAHAGVRKQVATLYPEKLVDDPDAQVRQQAAYALGESPSIVHRLVDGPGPNTQAGAALARLLLKDANDPYIVAACMSSVLPHLDTVLQHIVAAPGDISQRSGVIQQLIGVAVAADKLGALGAMLDVVTMPHGDQYHPWQFTTLSRLLDALAKKNITLAQLREKAERTDPRDRKLIMTLDRVPNMATVARAVIVDPAKAEALRVAAIDFYMRVGGEQRGAALTAALADVRSSPAVQQAAAQAIARLGGEKSFAALLAGWKAHAPALRAAILDALLRQDDGIAALLDALEKNIVSRHDIDIPRRQPLLTHKDKMVRERATKHLGGPVNADRQAVIDRYLTAMQKAPILPDPQAVAAGRAVFEKNCAVCHKLTTPAGEIGKGIGPDLQKIVDGSPAALLTAILDPNRAVEAKYVNYLAEKKDGDRVTGIITTETGTSITIVGVDGKEQTILRNDIESLQSTSLSLMPDGLEQSISALDMASLLSFIASAGPPAKTFENNKPRTIEADDKGVLTLPASAAEVRGATLIFEQQYRNLGYWSSESDHASWTIAVPPGRDGKYEVTIDYALPKEVKSNAYLLTIGESRLTGPVQETGSWDTYKTRSLGTLDLKAGTQRVVFRSAGPISGALIDLRTIVLTPK